VLLCRQLHQGMFQKLKFVKMTAGMVDLDEINRAKHLLWHSNWKNAFSI
jgi:hypothetical protein